MDSAITGDNVGVLLKGILEGEIRRGQLLTKPGTCNVVRNVELEMYLLKREELGRHTPIFPKFKCQFFFRTTNSPASFTDFIIEGQKMVMPGDNAKVIIKFSFLNF